MPLVSIITINLNNKSGLEKTISSVLSQSFQDLEYILIDGGSTDNSVDVIKNYSSNLSYWIIEPDNGIYNAMNKGIKVATGDYLIFLNSGDTLINNEILQAVSSFLINEEIIYGDIQVVDEDKSWIKNYPKKLYFSYFLHDTLPHPATFIKKEVFSRVGVYNESNFIVSDWEFFLLAINKYNCSYKYIPLTISNFSFDGISSKKQYSDIIKNETLKALSNHFPTFLIDYQEMDILKNEMQVLQHNYNLLINSRLYKLNNKIKEFFQM